MKIEIEKKEKGKKKLLFSLLLSDEKNFVVADCNRLYGGVCC
jgi:hypothetical protein